MWLPKILHRPLNLYTFRYFFFAIYRVWPVLFQVTMVERKLCGSGSTWRRLGLLIFSPVAPSEVSSTLPPAFLRRFPHLNWWFKDSRFHRYTLWSPLRQCDLWVLAIQIKSTCLVVSTFLALWASQHQHHIVPFYSREGRHLYSR